MSDLPPTLTCKQYGRAYSLLDRSCNDVGRVTAVLVQPRPGTPGSIVSKGELNTARFTAGTADCAGSEAGYRPTLALDEVKGVGCRCCRLVFFM